MTERLYWQDAYLREWTALVVARRDGARPQVALDRSAFYPEGGGQPADHGSIAGVAVLDVQAEDAVVWHTLAAPLEDDQVACGLDWPRRFDHMQQHHGQHLLSAAFEHLYNLRTVSFHLGVAGVTIDLAASAIDPAQLVAVEDLANEVIWADYPVLARFVEPAELATLRLRKPPSVSGAIRVVSAGDFDHSACGGTHPRSTGGVGLIHIRRIERRGEMVRVEFVCGGRAVRELRWKNATLGRLASSFSGSQEQVEEAVGRLREAEESARRRLGEAATLLIAAEARELVAGATTVGELPVVCRSWVERPFEEVRTLAAAVAATGALALLGVRGAKTQLIFAGGGGQVDCGQLLRTSIAPFGGKGGGNATQAQGGLPAADQLEAALEQACQQLAAGS
ncbi:MAG: hypothetical protein H0T53_12890 [Herpetosiphonaceae bacterium]|nr:hypothetical protein [Herpetosiphonaceae bacterium]